MNTLVCPKGHINVENALDSNVNRGLRCLTCEDVMICAGCRHTVKRIHGRRGLEWPGVRWIGSMELAEIGIIKRGNPADGGVYALCPSCKQKTMHKEGRTSWHDLDAFRRDGGKHFRLDVLPREAQCKSYVVADAELTILCDVHAEGYRKLVDEHGLVPLGTPEAGDDARCTMCYNRKPTAGGIVMSGRVFIDGKPYESYAAVLAEIDRQNRSIGLPSDAEHHAAVDRYRELEEDTKWRVHRDRRAIWTHIPGGEVRPDEMLAPDLIVGETVTAPLRKNVPPPPPNDPEAEAKVDAELREILGYAPPQPFGRMIVMQREPDPDEEDRKAEEAIDRFLEDNKDRIAGIRVVDNPDNG